MAGRIISNAIQLGDSLTDTQNFQIKSGLDGSAKFSRGAIGSIADILTIDVSNNVAFANSITAIGNVTAYFSDDRLKTRHGNIENALDMVNSLNGFYYEANQTANDLGYEIKREVGVSAQEVQKILPEIVVPAPIDATYLTVQYEKIIPVLIEAIKELSLKITLLESK